MNTAQGLGLEDEIWVMLWDILTLSMMCDFDWNKYIFGLWVLYPHESIIHNSFCILTPETLAWKQIWNTNYYLSALSQISVQATIDWQWIFNVCTQLDQVLYQPIPLTFAPIGCTPLNNPLELDINFCCWFYHCKITVKIKFQHLSFISLVIKYWNPTMKSEPWTPQGK